MLLCSYPDIHDGVTLYWTRLTGAIRINYECASYYPHFRPKIHSQIKFSQYSELHFEPPKYIFINDPSRYSIDRLLAILKSCGVRESPTIYINEGGKEHSHFRHDKVRSLGILKSSNQSVATLGDLSNCVIKEEHSSPWLS